MGEDVAQHASQQAVKNEPASSGVSRRRITFRPYSIPQSVATSSAQPSTSATNPEPEQSTSAAAAATNLGKTTRKWGIWSNSEIYAFYDGIKQHGKDFDQVAKLMARKKMNKDKDQIRNYYYNSFKLLRSTAQFEDDVINEFPRDARELFIVINGFEWKKRTEDMKFDPAKLRQLVLEGSTSVRLKKKKQNLVVRTPFCPSLQKFLPSRKTKEPLPTHVVIWLTPKTEADRSYVESCGQNPLLRIRISVSDQIARIFFLLKLKWMPRIAKQDIFQNEDFVMDSEKLNLVLYPDKCTKVESVFLKYVKDTTSAMISLNRLKRERNWPSVEENDEPSNPEDGLGPSTSLTASERPSAETTNEEANVLMADTNAFGLSALRLRAGLTEQAVGNATITELFYLCGMESDIRLQYSTNSEKRSSVEPWNVFISLLNRNYGENLCKILSEPNDVEGSRQFLDVVEGTRKRRISTSAHLEMANPLPLASEKQAVSVDVPSTSESVVVIHDHVVETENNAFKLQLESMQQPRKRGRSLVQRSAPPKNAFATRVGAHPMQIGSFMTSMRPTTATVSGPECYFISAQDLAQARQTNSGQFIDFSSIASSSIGHTHGQLSTNETCNSTPNTTPNTHFAAEVLTSMSHQLQGDLSNDTSFLQFDNSTTVQHIGHESTFRFKGPESESTEKTLTELSAVEFCGNGTNVDLTPTKNTSNLPEDVRHSFEMMMQQNSVDYCRNFEQLITSIETPKKIP